MSKTNALILLCIIVSLLLWGPGSRLAPLLSFSTANLLSWRIWTPVTTLFVHASLLHLLGNMLFLYVFGNTLENTVGSRKLLTAFFTGGVVAVILSIPFYPAEVSLVGSSAAIFTLTAIVMLVKPLKFSWLFLLPQGLVSVVYFLYNAFAVYYGISGGVAYISHIIGFLVGFPFGIAWSPRWLRNLAVTFILLVVYVAILYYLSPFLLGVAKKTISGL